jgi:hypothetical protein
MDFDSWRNFKIIVTVIFDDNLNIDQQFNFISNSNIKSVLTIYCNVCCSLVQAFVNDHCYSRGAALIVTNGGQLTFKK